MRKFLPLFFLLVALGRASSLTFQIQSVDGGHCQFGLYLVEQRPSGNVYRYDLSQVWYNQSDGAFVTIQVPDYILGSDGSYYPVRVDAYEADNAPYTGFSWAPQFTVVHDFSYILTFQKSTEPHFKLTTTIGEYSSNGSAGQSSGVPPIPFSSVLMLFVAGFGVVVVPAALLLITGSAKRGLSIAGW